MNEIKSWNRKTFQIVLWFIIMFNLSYYTLNNLKKFIFRMFIKDLMRPSINIKYVRVIYVLIRNWFDLFMNMIFCLYPMYYKCICRLFYNRKSLKKTQHLFRILFSLFQALRRRDRRGLPSPTDRYLHNSWKLSCSLSLTSIILVRYTEYDMLKH